VGPTRRELARRRAAVLLARAVLPPGGTYVATEPAGDCHHLSQATQTVGNPDSVDLHRYAVAPGSAATLDQWVAAHLPAGSTAAGSGTAGRYGVTYEWDETFSWPTEGPVFQLEWLQVQLAQLNCPSGAPGGADEVGIRVDATVSYYPARPQDDYVAEGASEMTAVLTPEMNPGEPGGMRVVTHNRAVIAAIIRRIDAARTEPPGMFSCPIDTGGILTLTFRRAGASTPYATVVADATGCQTMTIRRDGRAVTPALEAGGFVSFVEQELHRSPPPLT
jgi:hypothetical protein